MNGNHHLGSHPGSANNGSIGSAIGFAKMQLKAREFGKEITNATTA